jgi:hypothetical protein
MDSEGAPPSVFLRVGLVTWNKQYQSSKLRHFRVDQRRDDLAGRYIKRVKFSGNRPLTSIREIAKFDSTLSLYLHVCFVRYELNGLGNGRYFETSDSRGLDYCRPIALHAIRSDPRDNLSVPFVRGCLTGFLPAPRRDVFYVRTTVRLSDADRNQTLEHDFLAVKVELVRLWPTPPTVSRRSLTYY